MAAKKQAADRRVVISTEDYQPAELLALGKLCDPSSKAAREARTKIEHAKVHPVDVTVRVVGTIEIGRPEKTPEKFESEPYLLAALAALSADKRKQILKRPVIKRSVAGAMRAEIEAVKEKRKMVDGPAKLTPHLTVTRLSERFSDVLQKSLAA